MFSLEIEDSGGGLRGGGAGPNRRETGRTLLTGHLVRQVPFGHGSQVALLDSEVNWRPVGHSSEHSSDEMAWSVLVSVFPERMPFVSSTCAGPDGRCR